MSRDSNDNHIPPPVMFGKHKRLGGRERSICSNQECHLPMSMLVVELVFASSKSCAGQRLATRRGQKFTHHRHGAVMRVLLGASTGHASALKPVSEPGACL